jgi:hypothetical protein
VGFVVDKVAPGQVFSEYFGFRRQFAFHRLLNNHHHHLSSGAGTIGQTVAALPSGLNSPHEGEKINKNNNNLSNGNLVLCRL